MSKINMSAFCLFCHMVCPFEFEEIPILNLIGLFSYTGKSCTFHSNGGAEWLRKMGMNTCKKGSIEIYNAAAYLECRNLWGVGGVIIHEFSHAFHNKHCPDGYECSDIREVLCVTICM